MDGGKGRLENERWKMKGGREGWKGRIGDWVRRFKNNDNDNNNNDDDDKMGGKEGKRKRKRRRWGSEEGKGFEEMWGSRDCVWIRDSGHDMREKKHGRVPTNNNNNNHNTYVVVIADDDDDRHFDIIKTRTDHAEIEYNQKVGRRERDVHILYTASSS